MRKLLYCILSLLIIIPLGAWLGLSWLLTPSAVVKLAEKQIAGRLHLDAIDTPPWALLSGISLRNVQLSGPDNQQGLSLQERQPIERPWLVAPEVQVKLDLWDLAVSGGEKIEVQSIQISQPQIQLEVFADGTTNFHKLLPKQKSAHRTPEVEVVWAGLGTSAAAAGKDAKPAGAAPFNAAQIPLRIKMDTAQITDAQVQVHLHQHKARVDLSNFQIKLEDVAIDPHNLKQHNQLQLSSSGKIEISEQPHLQSLEAMELSYSLDSLIKPFNPDSGALRQSLEAQLEIAEGSYFTGLTLLERLREKQETLKKYGVDLSPLGRKLTLKETAQARVRYDDGKLLFLTPPTLTTEDTVLRLDQKSWLNVLTLQHHFDGLLLLRQQHSKKVEDQVALQVDRLVNKALRSAPKPLRKQIQKQISSQQQTAADEVLKALRHQPSGLYGFKFQSSASLTKPKTKVGTPEYPDFKQLVKANLSKSLEKNLSKQQKKKFEEKKREALDHLRKKLGL